MYSYERLQIPSDQEMHDALRAAAQRMRKKQDELECYPKWAFAIRWNSSSTGNFFGKMGKDLDDKVSDGFIGFDLDPRLLAGILFGRIHWNNAEVGCHIQMSRLPNKYNPDVHLLMCYFHI